MTLVLLFVFNARKVVHSVLTPPSVTPASQASS